MSEILQDVFGGLAAGSIYGALALALVFVFRATGVVNFAQGEMAMVSTFFALSLLTLDLPLGVAIAGAMAGAFVLGMVVERVLIRQVVGRGDHTPSIVTVGLFLAFNGLAGWIWSLDPQRFPSMFPSDSVGFLGTRIAVSAIGTVGVLLLVVGVLYVVFDRTRFGLLMRAAASNPESSALAGVPVNRMLMAGWGLAAAVGALAGALIAPQVFLSPGMMGPVIVYALAAAALGGLNSPLGAVVGGWIIGVAEALAANHVSFIGADLKILVPLVVIFFVLLFRPAGLLGTQEVARV